MKKKLSMILIFILSIIAVFSTFCKVQASTVTNVEPDGVTWSGSRVGHFQIDGRTAFCIDHSKTSPGTGVDYWGEVYNDARVRKILYYGWDGAGQWNGFNGDYRKGIVITTMELNKYFNGGDRSYLAEFESFLDSQPDPSFSTNFSNRWLTAHVEGNKQVTNQTEITGSDRIQLTFKLQDGVTLYCDNKGWTGNGTVTVSAGDVIHFEAPLTVNGNWTSSSIVNQATMQPLLFTTSNSSLQRLATSGDIVVDPSGTTNISIEWVNLADLEIHKIDSETGEGIPNTTFKVTGDGINETLTTDENGYARLRQIKPTTYKIKETNSNPDYYIDETEKEVTLTAGITNTVEIRNTHIAGKLKIIKLDKLNNETKIQGVKFEVYNEELSKVMASGVTDENGELKFENLRTGSYKLYEVDTNQWYRLDETRRDIIINKDEVTNITIENDQKYSHIGINKYDEDYPSIKLEGAVFEIYNSKGELVDTITTDENGFAKSIALPILDTYTVKEVRSITDYSINPKETTVNFTRPIDNQTVTVDYTNKHDEGELEILKVNKLDSTMKIQGVKFELYSEEFNRVIASGTTDENGKLKFSNIRTGQYKLYEVSTDRWYRLNEEKFNITIRKNETTHQTVENQPKMGYIAINKYDKDYPYMKLENAKFAVINSKGETVDIIITDSNGYGKSKAIPIYETYTVKEIEAPLHYHINETETTVTYNSNEDEVTKEFEYYDIRKIGNLKVYKVDELNHRIALGNVEFDLYSKEFDQIIGTYFTDVNGEIVVNDLREADYVWIEKVTNQWYNLTERTEVAVIGDQTVETMIINNLKKGRIKIVKVDKDNNEIVLKGVKFELLDEKGNLLETLITDENGEAITKEYIVRDFENLILREVETLKEYKLNEEPIKITLKANQVFTQKVENEVKKGQIKIIKVDKDNHKIKLKGVIFEVLDEKGNVVDTITTDENGEAITKRLPISKTYSVREKETLKEYKLNTEEITEIKLQEDEIKTLEFTNELKKAKIQIIKVDKEDNTIKLKDVVFEIYNSKDELVDTIITDENGVAESKRLPVNDTYYLKETKTSKYYELNDEIVEFDFTKYITDYKNNIVENVTIENQVKKGKIKIIKTDGETTYPLKDIVFEIYDSKENLIETIITDENGEAISKDLRIDEIYTIKEKTTKEGYILSDKVETVELKENEITNVSFENFKEKIPNEENDTPKTGDESNIKFLVGIVVLSLLGIAYISNKLYKEKKNQ